MSSTISGRAFGLNRNTISNAKNNLDVKFNELKLPKISRDKTVIFYPLLVEFLKANSQTKSGIEFFIIIKAITHHFILFFMRLFQLFYNINLSIRCLAFVLLIGRDTPSFFGTAQKCFQKYQEFCAAKLLDRSFIIQTERVFHRERKLLRVGIEKGHVLK